MILFNPSVFWVWLRIIAGALIRHNRQNGLILFPWGTITGVSTLDIRKIFLADKIRPILKQKSVTWIFRASGLLMSGVGIRLLVSGLTS